MFDNNVKKNMYFGTLYQFISLVLGFILRKNVVDYLGVYNLGVNGVFENVMSMLSLLNFGFGTSCMYYLYKAFASNNNLEVVKIYRIFKKLFKYVSAGILLLGLVLTININLIIDIENNKVFLQGIFLIYLLKQILYYLLICPRVFLQCEGKRYINVIADSISAVVFFFLKLYFLRTTRNYYIYIILLTAELFVSYLIINIGFTKEYRKYIDYEATPTDDKTLYNRIINYAKTLAVTNIASFIYNSTDNIILSKFCGIITVGLMSNYYMIVNAVKGFVVQLLDAIEARVITRYNQDGVDKKTEYLLSMSFSFLIASFCGVCLIVLTNDFVSLYFGNNYKMSDEIIILMTTILIITIFRNPSKLLISSQKMVKKELPYIIVMIILNILLSVVLTIKVGEKGVLLGTVIAEVVLLFGDEYIVYKYILNGDTEIMIKKFVYMLTMAIEIVISKLICFEITNYLGIIYNFFICTFVTLVGFLLFIKTDECKAIVNGIIKRTRDE